MHEIVATSRVMQNYQTVVPAQIRQRVHAEIGDLLVWTLEDSKIEVVRRKKPSLENLINLGSAKKSTNAIELKKKIQRGEKLDDLRR